MIKVFMEGRIATDAKVFEYGKNEVKTGMSFGLICPKFYNDEEPTYIQCTIWGPDEKLAQYFTTGKQIIATGTLSRNKDGYYSVSIDDFSFGATPKGGEQSTRNADNNNKNNYNYGDDDLSFKRT